MTGNRWMNEWPYETLLLFGIVLPENPTNVTSYPCLLRDKAWYCIRGLRPMSPNTSTHTRRSVPPSLCRNLHNNNNTSTVKTVTHTTRHITSEPVTYKTDKIDAVSAKTVQTAVPAPCVAMFVYDDVAEWWGRSFRFKGTADYWCEAENTVCHSYTGGLQTPPAQKYVFSYSQDS